MRWFRKLILRFNPPKTGDVYYSDPLLCGASGYLERIMHGMKDKSGANIWQVIPSKDAYRFTIESDSMPYYRCTGEVLATNSDFSQTKWLVRSQPRRIMKSKFIDMILDGQIKKK